MSWKKIFGMHGMLDILKDIWYRMDSSKPNPYSIKKFLQRNVNLRINKPRFRGTNDEIVLKILKWVNKNIKYVSDKKAHNKIEYWQDAREVLISKFDDCEGHATLIYTLARQHNISPAQIRFCCGKIKLNTGKIVGHAFVEYMADETMEWYIIDSTFRYDTSKFDCRLPAFQCWDYVQKWWGLTDFV